MRSGLAPATVCERRFGGGFSRVDIVAIKQKLEALAKRDWPDEWGAHEEETIGDYYGWCHRYRVEDRLPERSAAMFERSSGVQLPTEYRQFLTLLGNGGAGPYYGIHPFCEDEDGNLPEEILRNAATPFSHRAPWNKKAQPGSGGEEAYYSYSLMAGALPIATEGCALDYWIVVTGAQAGQIWFDKRTDGEGIEPVLDAAGQITTFGPWYQAWLESAYRKSSGG